MHLSERFWAGVIYVSSWLLPSAIHPNEPQQIAISGISNNHQQVALAPPLFKPPGGRKNGTGDDFKCYYPQMKGWSFCAHNDQTCWLTKDDGSEKPFDISTDYEKRWPIGIDRYYDLEVYDGHFNADGVEFPFAKLFNSSNPGPLFESSFPGPWIQACWGDTVHVKVTNKMVNNGTSVHWHGIRQLHSTNMDGVNGVTQCPIAPGDHFDYTFKVTQYGSSWYHSHYSVQYADGLQGPITLHGPSTAQFDEAKLPLIMSDWGHSDAFASTYNFDMGRPSIVLNGRGNITKFDGKPNTTLIPEPFKWTFKRDPESPWRYLLRIINTSFASAMIFSIDNHLLEVVEADFVPIHPYKTTSILVNIGQRYDVIVEASPDNSTGKVPTDPKEQNFWIRTYLSEDCTELPISATYPIPGYSEAGILRYDDNSSGVPNSKVSIPWDILPCMDESYADSYQPYLNWTLPHPKNQLSNENNHKTGPANGKTGEQFNVTTDPNAKVLPYELARFSLQPAAKPGLTALRVDYGDPMFLHLNDVSESWPTDWVVVGEDYNDDDWVYIVLQGGHGNHPIHLHGHDFAIVQWNNTHAWEPSYFANNKWDNPPRRDVVLLPSTGFVVIAFKTDNPGNWLMHCHIAWHASWGLGMQILERRGAADHRFPHGDSEAIAEAERVCKNWNFYFSDCRNWYPGFNKTSGKYDACAVYDVNLESFQDDSGI